MLLEVLRCQLTDEWGSKYNVLATVQFHMTDTFQNCIVEVNDTHEIVIMEMTNVFLAEHRLATILRPECSWRADSCQLFLPRRTA